MRHWRYNSSKVFVKMEGKCRVLTATLQQSVHFRIQSLRVVIAKDNWDTQINTHTLNKLEQEEVKQTQQTRNTTDVQNNTWSEANKKRKQKDMMQKKWTNIKINKTEKKLLKLTQKDQTLNKRRTKENKKTHTTSFTIIIKYLIHFLIFSTHLGFWCAGIKHYLHWTDRMINSLNLFEKHLSSSHHLLNSAVCLVRLPPRTVRGRRPKTQMIWSLEF